MKCKIKFEVHLSTNEAHFLDIKISLKHGKLRTTLLLNLEIPTSV